MPLAVRPATPADIPELAATVHEGFESYRAWAPRGWDPPPLALHVGTLEDRLPRSVCFVAEDDGRMAGHAGFLPAREEPGVAHLWMLFIRAPWWGTGLARDLLGRIVTAATGEGYGSMRLVTPAEHARARRFYEREGWRADGEAVFEPLLGLTIVTYRRSLGAGAAGATP